MTQKRYILQAARPATRQKARMPDRSSLHLQAGSFVEERYAALPDGGLAPEQFFLPAQESAACWSGARRLLLAVLGEALQTFWRYHSDSTRRGKRLFEEVQHWFESTDDRGLYSFESICAHLNLNPDTIRRKLRQSRQLDPSSSQSRPTCRSKTPPFTSAVNGEAA